MPRPSLNLLIESVKNACKTDPELKDTYTSRMLNFDETRFEVEFKIRGKGTLVKWIPQSSSVQK